MFVFKPSEPRPLFSHKAVCSGKVTRAVFAPREEMLESCEESSQWLNRSRLYFLTQYMVNATRWNVIQQQKLEYRATRVDKFNRDIFLQVSVFPETQTVLVLSNCHLCIVKNL